MAYPIKYIENNLVFNHDGECFAYYDSFLSPEEKSEVHDHFRQLIAQSRDGKIHALQIATESSIRATQARSKQTVTGKLKEVACRKIDEQTEALVEMLGENQIDYRFFLGFKLLLTDQKVNLKSIGESIVMSFSEFLHEVNHGLMGDFVSMNIKEINRFMKMERLLENKIARRFNVRRLDKEDFGYLIEHLYGKTGSSFEFYTYPLNHYQLDFYVDQSWDWLPWNWTDGIGKQVMYGLYAITNFVWALSLFLSNATGYLVQEAYALDFVSTTSDAIGKNMQTLAGISPSGFQSTGFYPGFLLMFVLILGIYVTYVGLIKRETTKAMRAVMNFFVVFLLSTSFIAYAPDYIAKINSFLADVSQASLSLGTKMVMPHSASRGQDSAALIRDNLFAIQVQQPWLLLQYGNSDVTKIGPKRVEKLLSKSPDTRNGQDREAVVKEEIEKENNKNLTLTKTTPRLGMVCFLFLFNIGISIFVFLLAGIMIFSQILFIIYALFLPISFLLSMISGFNGMGKQAIMKLFNVIMTRAGITLIVTIAFSISTMLYALSGTFPFFLIAFLQIVTFAGIYAKLGDLMGQFHLQASDAQQMGRRVLHRPYRFFSREARRWKRSMGRFFTAGGPVRQRERGQEPKKLRNREPRKVRGRAPNARHGNLLPHSSNPSLKAGPIEPPMRVKQQKVERRNRPSKAARRPRPYPLSPAALCLKEKRRTKNITRRFRRPRAPKVVRFKKSRIKSSLVKHIACSSDRPLHNADWNWTGHVKRSQAHRPWLNDREPSSLK